MAKRPNPLRTLRAKLAYRNFTGRAPEGEYVADLDRKSQAAYKLGSLLGVAYEATRDGKTERYFHEFARRARPDLAVRDDGRQLYVTRGRYRVTDRGIEDMPALFVVNPSPRPSRRKSTTKRKVAPMARTRRRRSATRRFLKMARNPAKTRRRRRSSIIIARRNPATRRRRSALRTISRRRYRRNPIGGLRLMPMIGEAAWIGAGAVGTEIAMGYIPGIPASFKTGVTRHVTKGVVALVAGWALAKFVNRKAGESFALGGLTIAIHDALKQGLVTAVPSMQFGSYLPRVRGTPGIGYVSPGAPIRMGQ